MGTRRRLGVLTATAGLALALGLVGAGCSSAGSDSAAPAPAEPAPAEPAPAEPAPAPAPADGAPTGGSGELASLPLPGGTKVIQTASISLGVDEGRFDEAMDRARSIAAVAGGFVTSSSAQQGAEKALVRGSLTVRVPQERYADVMRQLSGLGQVEGREEEGQDVSQQYVDLEARVRHLEAVETRLLGFLDQTTTIGEALNVQGRVNDVQLQLEQLRGQLRFLDDQTSFATITVSIGERGALPVEDGEPKDDGWGLADAWHAAASGLEKVVGGLFVAAVWLAPIAGGLGVLYLAWRLLVRRRRSGGGPAAPTPAA
ncbi:MAG: DUF4349 domain-containing protein [Thermoleophilia bacterium]